MSTFVLDLREREVGGAVTSGHLFVALAAGGGEDADGVRLPDFTMLSANRELVVLLHGYNNTRMDGWVSLVRFAGFLERRGVTALKLGVLWPGDGWAKALTYPFEGRDADDSAAALAKWLTLHVGPATRVSFVAHSLGCRVAMRTAQILASRGASNPRIGRMCLMAGAVDNDCLGREGVTSYRAATLVTERIAILASEEDTVLALAYPLGDLAQTILFGERWGTALGRTGARESDSLVLERLERLPLSDKTRRIDHGDYLGIADANSQNTVGDTDEFVARFLTGPPPYTWRAARI